MTTKIVYDYQTFSIQEFGGISRYFHEISSRIAKSSDYDVNIVCPLYINKYFKDYPSNYDITKGFKINPIRYTGTLRDVINKQLSNLILSNLNVDIIHETYYSAKSTGSRKSKRVITVYDMIHEKFSSDIDPDNRNALIKAKAIERADHVICISENTRRDLIEILGVDETKISTIYIASASIHDLDLQAQQISLIDRPYLLYVGKRDPYKNFVRLFEAYHNSNRLNQDFQLVCFGGGEFSSSEIEKIRHFQLQNRVVQIPGDDNVLANLYHHAAAFVYPSLYEGFGIPPLEAMYLNCPVVCSNVSSIPEVVGDAGEYFDPYNLDSIINAIEKVVYSNEVSNNLRRLGRERAKFFSWDLCAEQTMKVYQSLV